MQHLAALTADLDKGLADLAADRTKEFDPAAIIERVRKLLAAFTLRLTDAAEQDLAELWAYIAVEASEALATHFLSAIEDTFQTLQHSPLIGPSVINSHRECE